MHEPGVGYQIITLKCITVDKEANIVTFDLWFEPDEESLMTVVVDIVADTVSVNDGSWEHFFKRYSDYLHTSKGNALGLPTQESLMHGLKRSAEYELGVLKF